MAILHDVDVATHEAAHVAVLWMFGYLHEVEFIDMRGKSNATAFIRRRPYGPDLPAEIRREAAKARRRGVRGHEGKLAKEEVVFKLAGYAANALAWDEPAWFEAKAAGLGMCGDDEEDLSSAYVLCAPFFNGDYRQTVRFLSRMSTWADQAVAHSRLRKVIEILADQLARTPHRMSGNEARSVIEDAWLVTEYFPYRQMGYRWRRRFDSAALASAP